MAYVESSNTPSLKDIDLVAALTREGYTLRASGKSWSGSVCPSCGPGESHSNKLSVFTADDDRQRWSCFACKSRGDFADFLAASRKVSMKEALSTAREMYRLGGVTDIPVNQKAARAPVFDPSKQQLSKKNGLKSASQVESTGEVWNLLLNHGHTSTTEVLPYFNGRGISKVTLERVVRKGMMRFLPVQSFAAFRLLVEKIGKPKLVHAGLWREEAKWPAAAFRPIVSFLPGGQSFELRLASEPDGNAPKAVRYGSAGWPWFYKEDRNRLSKRIYIVEGIIDLLSILEMGMVSFDDAVMAVPGVNTWRPEWADQALLRNPGAEFVDALDTDSAGERLSNTIRQQLDGRTKYQRIKPGLGCSDWNKFLLEQRKASVLARQA